MIVAPDPAEAVQHGLHVRHDGKVHRADAPVVDSRLPVGKMGKLGVDRAADDLCITILELFDAFGKCDQFSRADESKVKRVKKQDDIFPCVISKFKSNAC